MLDAAITSQLRTHFHNITRPVELVASLDGGDTSRQLAAFLDEIAALSGKITVARRDDDERRPSFAIVRAGTDVSVRFAGIPLGHELASSSTPASATSPSTAPCTATRSSSGR